MAEAKGGGLRVREVQAERALDVAYRFLGRWEDVFTRGARHELAHETAVVALGRRHTLRDPNKFPAFVRTIARRLRSQAARASLSRVQVSIDRDDSVREQLVQPEPDTVLLRVRDVPVDRETLLENLESMLGHLTALNRGILLGFYEGFSCAELAARYNMAEESVKVRVHRARRKLRRTFEHRVCSQTGGFRTGS